MHHLSNDQTLTNNHNKEIPYKTNEIPLLLKVVMCKQLTILLIMSVLRNLTIYTV